MQAGPLYRLVAINCRYSHTCLALLYLRQALEENCSGIRLDMMALTINDPYYPSLQRILAGDPAALFFSAYIWNGEYIARLTGDIARIRPEMPLVIGGPQAERLGSLPGSCTIVSGEIEGLAPGFYADLANDRLGPRYTGLPGLDFPSPYRHEDFLTLLKNRQILYESSRGCPFSCAYCLSASSKGLRHKPVRQVEEEMGLILAARPPLVKFVDRTFNDNPERALAIWQMLVEKGAGTRFHFEVAPDRFTQEQLAFLATVPVGLFQFEIGIQSTAAHTLAAVNRRMDVDRALAAISRLREMENIHLHVDLILGLPEDTGEDFADSFRAVFAIRPHHIQMGLLKVLPATPLAGQVERYGIIFCHHPPHEVLATRTMSAPTLARLHLFGECVERFYNNRYFPSLWRYLQGVEKDMFAFFSKLLTLCKQSDFFTQAPTQKRLVEELAHLCKRRPDWELIRELLVFDWLRCGHRFLPECLSRENLARIRNRARRYLPEEYPDLYTARTRNSFFKHTLFYPVSASAGAILGLENFSRGVLVGFLANSENGLYGLRAIVSLPMESCNFSQPAKAHFVVD